MFRNSPTQESQDRLFNSIHHSNTPASEIVADQPLNNLQRTICDKSYIPPSSNQLTKLYNIRDHLNLANIHKSLDLEILLLDCGIQDLESVKPSIDQTSRLGTHAGLAEMKVKWDEKAMSSLEETCLASTLVSNLFAWDWQCIQIVLGPERNFKLMRSLVLRKPHECEFVTRLLKLDMFQLFGLKVWFQYGKRRRRNIKRVEREEIVGILEKALREEELKSIRFVGSYADGEEEVDHISVLIVLASDSYDDIESRLFELEVDGILRFLISSRHSRQETWEKIDRIPQAAL